VALLALLALLALVAVPNRAAVAPQRQHLATAVAAVTVACHAGMPGDASGGTIGDFNQHQVIQFGISFAIFEGFWMVLTD